MIRNRSFALAIHTVIVIKILVSQYTLAHAAGMGEHRLLGVFELSRLTASCGEASFAPGPEGPIPAAQVTGRVEALSELSALLTDGDEFFRHLIREHPLSIGTGAFGFTFCDPVANKFILERAAVVSERYDRSLNITYYTSEYGITVAGIEFPDAFYLISIAASFKGSSLDPSEAFLLPAEFFSDQEFADPSSVSLALNALVKRRAEALSLPFSEFINSYQDCVFAQYCRHLRSVQSTQVSVADITFSFSNDRLKVYDVTVLSPYLQRQSYQRANFVKVLTSAVVAGEFGPHLIETIGRPLDPTNGLGGDLIEWIDTKISGAFASQCFIEWREVLDESLLSLIFLYHGRCPDHIGSVVIRADLDITSCDPLQEDLRSCALAFLAYGGASAPELGEMPYADSEELCATIAGETSCVGQRLVEGAFDFVIGGSLYLDKEQWFERSNRLPSGGEYGKFVVTNLETFGGNAGYVVGHDFSTLVGFWYRTTAVSRGEWQHSVKTDPVYIESDSVAGAWSIMPPDSSGRPRHVWLLSAPLKDFYHVVVGQEDPLAGYLLWHVVYTTVG